MELPKAWESLVNSSVAHSCATMRSRFCVLIINEIEKEKYGKEEGECWFY